MKFWHRIVVACFILAAGITWFVLIPAYQRHGDAPKPKKFSIELPREGKSDHFDSGPLDHIPDPAIRDTAHVIKGHMNVMRKDLHKSESGNNSRSEISDVELKGMLMKDESFKNKEILQGFERIAKVLGYSKKTPVVVNNRQNSAESAADAEEKADKDGVEKSAVVPANASDPGFVHWFQSKTYAPPAEQFVAAASLEILEKVLTKKNRSPKTRRRPGKKIQLHDPKRVSKLKSFQRFHNGITQFQLYSPDDPAVDDLLYDLSHLPITGLRTMSSYGTEIKLLFKLADSSYTLFKPIRFARDLETHPDHYYFDDLERFQAEIAAFHLDKVMAFYRVPPNAGRMINLTRDVQKYSDHKLNKTFYRSPVGNVCFYGKCDYYCDSGHSVCGNPYMVEGACAAMLPGVISAVKGGSVIARESYENPFTRSYSKRNRADWEDDMKFCDRVRRKPPYNSGRRMLDLVDIHIFDFLMGNMDRHHFHIFSNFGNYTSPFLFDNGRGFGKSRVDQVDILVPLYQCCVIRYSTLERLVKFHVGPEKLSDALRKSTSKDVLYPILSEVHLIAVDRRVKIILNKVVECIQRKKHEIDRVVIDDGF